MANDPTNPEVGELHIDATALSAVVVDLAPRAMMGLRSAQPGLDEAIAEIRSNQTTVGTKAGVSETMVNELASIGDQMTTIDRYLPAARKLVELLEETRAKLDDDRYQIISTIAGLVDKRSKKSGNEDLPAKYEKTRAYRSAIGVKAAQTRAKNADAQAGEDATP